MELPNEPIQRDDWESLMKAYLRRLWGLHGLESLGAPEEIVEHRRKLVRETFSRLTAAIRKDFGPRLIDGQTREFLENKFKTSADEVVYLTLWQKANVAVRPCESCINFKDTEWIDDGITDVGVDPDVKTSDVIREHCRLPQPELYTIGLKSHRFIFNPLEGCKSFVPAGSRSIEDLQEDGKRALDDAVGEFEKWRSGLHFSEALLD